MKKTKSAATTAPVTHTQPELPPAPAPAKAPDPVLDLKTAKSIPAYRHAATARTVAYHQPAGAAGVHLFSATGNYVATEAEAAAAVDSPESGVQSPEAPAPAPSA